MEKNDDVCVDTAGLVYSIAGSGTAAAAGIRRGYVSFYRRTDGRPEHRNSAGCFMVITLG